ncbi:MAG: hypothetical protein RLY86_703 [Pseudomonadota bacterium]|jgi:hypothetical protein
MSIASNFTFAWRNRVQTAAAITGPGWASLENLRTWNRGQSASYVGVQPTTVTLTWSAPETVDLGAVSRHNAAPLDTLRMDWYLRDVLVASSGDQPMWPRFPFGTVAFGDPRWWGHAVLPEDVGEWDGFWCWKLPSTILCDRLEVTWTARQSVPDDHRSMPVLFTGPCYQVPVNCDWGIAEGWLGESDLPGAERGVPLGEDGEDPRRLGMTFAHLPDQEALTKLGDMFRQCRRGRHPLLAIPDPTDRDNLHRRAMVGFLRDLPDLELVRRGRRRVRIELLEWMA